MEYDRLPKDPVMLLSFVNLKLRDEFKSFNDLCKSLCCDGDDIVNKLKLIDYEYDYTTNQFI